jgi:hypothetical protein
MYEFWFDDDITTFFFWQAHSQNRCHVPGQCSGHIEAYEVGLKIPPKQSNGMASMIPKSRVRRVPVIMNFEISSFPTIKLKFLLFAMTLT